MHNCICLLFLNVKLFFPIRKYILIMKNNQLGMVFWALSSGIFIFSKVVKTLQLIEEKLSKKCEEIKIFFTFFLKKKYIQNLE